MATTAVVTSQNHSKSRKLSPLQESIAKDVGSACPER